MQKETEVATEISNNESLVSTVVEKANVEQQRVKREKNGEENAWPVRVITSVYN